MRRFGMSDLRQRALAAVDEATDDANKGPVRRTLALRFTLAFLANLAGERWPFDKLLADDRKQKRPRPMAECERGEERHS
jgi:hypothetical protein